VVDGCSGKDLSRNGLDSENGFQGEDARFFERTVLHGAFVVSMSRLETPARTIGEVMGAEYTLLYGEAASQPVEEGTLLPRPGQTLPHSYIHYRYVLPPYGMAPDAPDAPQGQPRCRVAPDEALRASELSFAPHAPEAPSKPPQVLDDAPFFVFTDVRDIDDMLERAVGSRKLFCAGVSPDRTVMYTTTSHAVNPIPVQHSLSGSKTSLRVVDYGWAELAASFVRLALWRISNPTERAFTIDLPASEAFGATVPCERQGRRFTTDFVLDALEGVGAAKLPFRCVHLFQAAQFSNALCFVPFTSDDRSFDPSLACATRALHSRFGLLEAYRATDVAFSGVPLRRSFTNHHVVVRDHAPAVYVATARHDCRGQPSVSITINTTCRAVRDHLLQSPTFEKLT
jgi:hypothetical protein